MNKISIITHNEKFHPDDVFAVATLLIYLKDKDVEIIRTRDEEKIKEGDFVVDVGGSHDELNNIFDHHQIGGAGERVNGIPYASFGLVWKKFGKHVCGSEDIAESIDAKLVQVIDAYDNGVTLFKPLIEDVEPYLINNLIFSFLPTWKESPEAFDTNFLEAVNTTKALLEREIKRSQAKAEAATLVANCYTEAEDKRIIVLDQYFPWQDVIVEFTEPLFVVYPRTNEQKWNVSAVPVKKGQTFENRKDLPREWGGLRDGELAEVTGVPDAIFCHTKLFLAVAGSKEGALALAKLAINA
jgi:uncharacterized UPF0160 family protein